MPWKGDRYIPLESGLPSYFQAMVRDENREAQFTAAIGLMIDTFERTVGRAPHVVDLGAGSGTLSLAALKRGAAHVTLVDVNPDLLAMARQALEDHEYVEGEHFTVFHGSFTQMPYTVPLWEGEPFDALVSEILGTLTTSESMQEYVADALKFVNTFEGHGQFVVPVAATQTLSLCKLSVVEDENYTRRFPHDVVIGEWKNNSVVEFVPTNGHLGLHNLHMKPYEVLSSVSIRVDTFGGAAASPGCDVPESVSLRVPTTMGWNHFLLLQWSCRLFNDVVLENTLDGYKAHPATGVDRSVAWGFFLAGCGPLYDLCGKTVTFNVRYPRHQKGWPLISLFAKRAAKRTSPKIAL